MTGVQSQPQAIWNRKLDMFWVVFLSSCGFLALMIDFMPYYPVNLPSWATWLFDYFYTEYNDPLYKKDPPFFQLYMFIQLVYSLPTIIWTIRGLIKDEEMTPVHLLAFATHLVTSTLVCLVEMMGAKDWPKEDIKKNIPGYVIYLVASIGLWLDMFSRVKGTLKWKTKVA